MYDKVATACGLDEQEIEIRSQDKAEAIIFSKSSRPILWPIQTPILWEISTFPKNKADGARS